MTDSASNAIPHDHPGQPSDFGARVLETLALPYVRLCFRPTLKGTENLPEGPFLLVANHSAGMGMAEIVSFAATWFDQLGRTRPLAGFAHVLGFSIPGFRLVLNSVGAIPSTYEAAYEALGQGTPILVFPGGDHETMRPVWRANQVDFGGRRGFLRIARKTGLPIVPMGIQGSHYTAPVLLRSKALAWVLILPRALGIKRWGLSLASVLGASALALAPIWLPLKGFLIWAWLTSPLVFLPILPVTIRFRIGEPIAAEDLFRDDDEELHEALATVEQAVGHLVRS